jgi:MoaA/NifB/PqqE/SkfB family radical SAM enzyme
MAAGVARIRSLAPDFQIGGRCTVQHSNFSHLTATVDAAHDLGLTSISFLAADLESSAFRRPGGWPLEKQHEVGLASDEVSHLESEIEAVIARGDCGRFVSESAAKLRKIVHHFRCHCGSAKPIAPLCNAPWASAVVEADGAVRPCFFHPPIGHLNSGKPLDEILNGPEAVAFRGTLDVATNPVCKKCVCSLNWKAA